MERMPVVLLGLVAACGPGMSTDGSGESESESATETSVTNTESTEESDTGGEETGSDPSECYGGEPLELDWGTLEPALRDEEFWDGHTTHALTCAVAEVVDPQGDDRWQVTLACEGDGASIDLHWSVPVAFGLLDASWLGTNLSVVASGNYGGSDRFLRGWVVVRDEHGELVWISGRVHLPEPQWTDPVSIEVLDLGHDCTLSDDECYPIYANVVLFESALDGELRSYEGGGHQTEHFTYLGASTTYEQDFLPFDDECEMLFDYFIGRLDEVRVVRRP